MKITFFSNFLNHHQLPFCQEMVKILGNEFKFVATERIPVERVNLGYEDMNEKYNFVVCSYKNENEAFKLGIESDIVIIGSAPDKYIKQRLKQKKIIFRYSERIFKNGFKLKIFLSILLKRTVLERNKTYLLCASAYSTYDYNLAGAYKNKTFKWGYFPELKEYTNINKLIEKKEKNTILWVARFIDWKHPEIVINVAKMLKEEKYEFSINMIGTGKMYNLIDKLIKENNLEDNVKLLGPMSPEDVRKYMENSKIFLFTSDRNEGWGAVLNEAMNSGCAVIASHEIGSVPYLIKDKKNGLIYKNGNINDLYDKVKLLLDNNDLSTKLGIEAYNTMINLWNPKIAAERIIEFSHNLLKNDKFIYFNEGPLSVAKNMKDSWHKSIKENKSDKNNF